MLTSEYKLISEALIHHHLTPRTWTIIASGLRAQYILRNKKHIMSVLPFLSFTLKAISSKHSLKDVLHCCAWMGSGLMYITTYTVD